jgi:hypothetical protein
MIKPRTPDSILFTIVTEKSGGTYLEQFCTNNINEALQEWSQKSTSTPRLQSTARLEDETVVTPVAGLVNVWCTSILDDNEDFYLLHMIATDTSKTSQQ